MVGSHGLKLALLATAALVALATAAAVEGSGLREKPAGVDWGNAHFSRPTGLRVWLDNRGVRYEDWLRRHPRARYLWAHPRRSPAPAVAPSPPAQPVTVAGAGSRAPRWMFLVVLLLLLLAVTPSRLLARAVPGRRASALAPARIALAAAALSLALGILIASLL